MGDTGLRVGLESLFPSRSPPCAKQLVVDDRGAVRDLVPEVAYTFSPVYRRRILVSEIEELIILARMLQTNSGDTLKGVVVRMAEILDLYYS